MIKRKEGRKEGRKKERKKERGKYPKFCLRKGSERSVGLEIKVERNREKVEGRKRGQKNGFIL